MRLTREQMVEIGMIGAEIYEILICDKKETRSCLKDVIYKMCDYANDVGINYAIIQTIATIKQTKEDVCHREKEKLDRNLK